MLMQTMKNDWNLISYWTEKTKHRRREKLSICYSISIPHFCWQWRNEINVPRKEVIQYDFLWTFAKIYSEDQNKHSAFVFSTKDKRGVVLPEKRHIQYIEHRTAGKAARLGLAEGKWPSRASFVGYSSFRGCPVCVHLPPPFFLSTLTS